MKTLVIAEKPDMGRNIAAVIEPKAKNNRTYLEGERYIITWAIGHLITLAEPDHYDDKYKKWRLDDLPIIPQSFKLIPNRKTKDQLKVISELARRCDQIVNACDAGREGQYIFHLIQRYLKLRQPVKRLWISDLTKETILNGFSRLKDAAEFENLTKAACARSEADWLIGMNGSRAFTTKHNVLLSVGRVQTPVLALIYDRQKSIEDFSSLTYYQVKGHFQQDELRYSGTLQGERLQDRGAAERIAADTSGQTGRIESYECKETKEHPYKLFDLTLLQREANAKFGYSAKKTLDVAQALYEKHKVITYPRTNSNYVTEQNIPDMHRTLDMLLSTSYSELVRQANKSLVHVRNRAICNPSKVEDHHAILPTRKRPSSMAADEQNIYDLIVRRFLSHFFHVAEYKVHTVITTVKGHLFKTVVKELIKLGWKIVYENQGQGKTKSIRQSQEDSNDEQETTDPFILDSKQPIVCKETTVHEKETKPPKPYTEGTLLKAMESAGKQIEDDALREAMKDQGLGTPATRAATIERLKKVGYIEMKGKRIVITPKGRSAIEVIRGAGVRLLTSPEMTGRWEHRLNEISKGAADAGSFMEQVKTFAAYIADQVRAQPRAAASTFEASAKKAKPKRRQSSPSSSAEQKPSRPSQPANKNIIGICPRPGCGGHIFMGRKGYGCSEYRNGCAFVIWKESFGKTLTDSMIKALITKGNTNKLKLKQSDGVSIDIRLHMQDPSTGALKLERL